AEVVLITGPVSLPDPPGICVERVETTEQMAEAVRAALPVADLLIMAAAPADFRPVRTEATKRPRGDGSLTLEFEATEDILTSTRDARKKDAVIVGFALETGNAYPRAQEKLKKKALDLIVVNDALEPGAGFDVDTNRVTLISPTESRALPLMSKEQVADAILDQIEPRLV
ncbi:MAG: phosphopantothenoylcysteine decarboxylase, partial [Gemmatimonadota bacterium]